MHVFRTCLRFRPGPIITYSRTLPPKQGLVPYKGDYRTQIQHRHRLGQMRSEEVFPGAVVFARVTSFPWWPAIVGRCPTTKQWKDNQERRWVFFFNDPTGAWLKIRDMRPFSRSSQDAMAEINRLTPKYRKYLVRIAEACELAHEYQRGPAVKKPFSDYNKRLTRAAVEMTPSTDSASGSVETAYVSRADQIVTGSTSPENSVRNLESGRARTGIKRDAEESGLNNAGRPRRKRKKSTRYEGFINPSQPRIRNGKRKAGSRDGENVNMPKDTKAVAPMFPVRRGKGVNTTGSASDTNRGANLGVPVDADAKAPDRGGRNAVREKSDGGIVNVGTDNQVMLLRNRREDRLSATNATKPSRPKFDQVGMRIVEDDINGVRDIDAKYSCRPNFSGSDERGDIGPKHSDRGQGETADIIFQTSRPGVALVGAEKSASSVTEADDNASPVIRRGRRAADAMYGGESSVNGHPPQAQGAAETMDGLQNRVSTLEATSGHCRPAPGWAVVERLWRILLRQR